MGRCDRPGGFVAARGWRGTRQARIGAASGPQLLQHSVDAKPDHAPPAGSGGEYADPDPTAIRMNGVNGEVGARRRFDALERLYVRHRRHDRFSLPYAAERLPDIRSAMSRISPRWRR